MVSSIEPLISHSAEYEFLYFSLSSMGAEYVVSPVVMGMNGKETCISRCIIAYSDDVLRITCIFARLVRLNPYSSGRLVSLNLSRDSTI